MSEQKSPSIKMIITVTLEGAPCISVDVKTDTTVGKYQPYTEYFLEKIKEYISGEEVTAAAIKKAGQDTMIKLRTH